MRLMWRLCMERASYPTAQVASNWLIWVFRTGYQFVINGLYYFLSAPEYMKVGQDFLSMQSHGLLGLGFDTKISMGLHV